MPSLGLRVLVEGEPGATDVPLLWVHNTELLDPSAYLRERELVLTNGLWHDGGNATEFVTNVVHAGGAGIVYGLRDVTPEAPPDLIAACEETGLPLLELAIEVPFTEVTRAAAAELSERRQKALVDMVRRGNALAAAVSRGSGASGMLRIVRRGHQLPLAVVDRTGRVLATAGASLAPDAAAVVGEALRRSPPPLEVDLGRDGRAALFLVTALGRADAALVCLRPLERLDNGEQDALNQAAHYLSLEVAKRHVAQAVEARFAGELLEMILSGGEVAAELPPRLEAFGIDPNSSMIVVAAAYHDQDASPDADLAASVGDFFPAEGLPAVVADGTRDVVAIFRWNGSPEEALVVVRRMLAQARRQTPQTRVVAGMSGPALGSHHLRGPLYEAREACRVLRRRSAGPPVAWFHELETHRLLLGGQDRDALLRFGHNVLAPMREYDQRQGGRLEETIRVFLANDGKLAATAADLYIHVNTLRNRLAKLAELTGRDVMTTAGRVDLFLALEADDIARPIG